MISAAGGCELSTTCVKTACKKLKKLIPVKTAFDIQVDGMRGPWRPKITWKQLTRGIAESGSSQLSTLITETPGDLV